MKSPLRHGFTRSILGPVRLVTREVKLGDLGLGAHHPIRIQSMTNTDTMDTTATVAQSLRMVAAGCEIVRVTAPNLDAAKNLEAIKKALREKGCTVPLVADIHFTPNAAEVAARLVEKVRVNPGNYADRKAFKVLEYTDGDYKGELERLAGKFRPLVKICKEYGTAMRIGANHGSLSDRILSRFGDTPLGMVESALEFLDICEDEGYHNIVLSMKASNTQVMVQAYRLLVRRMVERGNVYPLHLGVTEAGEGEDGRIKSAAGIGALLMDGIGDTIRVSLTEDPEVEGPVAKRILDISGNLPSVEHGEERDLGYNPESFERRASSPRGAIGAGKPPVVIATLDHDDRKTALEQLGWSVQNVDTWRRSDASADFILDRGAAPHAEDPSVPLVRPAPVWKKLARRDSSYPHFADFEDFFKATEIHPAVNFISVWPESLSHPSFTAETLAHGVLILRCHGMDPRSLRHSLAVLHEKGITAPVLAEVPALPGNPDDEGYALSWACGLGSLLLDGRLDGLWLSEGSPRAVRTAFNLLQACRLRMSKTEYISCPSCGRTEFDLQQVSARIRARTGHLKGLKIAVMGCIVNGPGEMADADFGYVGTGPGKISLYKGHQVVVRNIEESVAVERLVDLIREHGSWVDAPAT